jgi:hypothetical protein
VSIDGNDGIKRTGRAGRVDRVAQAVVGRLYVDLVVDHNLDRVSANAVGDPARDPPLRQHRVGDDKDAFHVLLDQVPTDLLRGAGPELQGRRTVGENSLKSHEG